MSRLHVLLLISILSLTLQSAAAREGFRSLEPRPDDAASTSAELGDEHVARSLPPLPKTRPPSFVLPAPVPRAAEYVGEDRLRQQLPTADNHQRPTALAADDFDEDGVPDLIGGYTGPAGHLLTLHRGNVDAIYPDSPGARQRKSADTFTDAAFLTPGRILEAPVAPHFIRVGDFDADGHRDVVIASRGGGSLHLLAGDGRGGFEAARPVAIPGSVTTMVGGEINRRDGLADLVVGVTGADGSALLVFEGPRGALSHEPERIALAAAPTALALGRLDDGHPVDLAVAAGGDLIVLHGRDRQLFVHPQRRTGVGPAVVETIARLETPIVSIAVGDYVWDERRRSELAAMTAAGTVHVAQRDGDAWRMLGHRRVLGRATAGSQLLTARVSALPLDELVIVDDTGLQLMLGEVRPEGDALPEDLGPPLSKTLASPAVAVLPMRLNGDGLADLVLLRDETPAPEILPSAPRAVITVNSALDPPADNGLCELAEAMANANTNSVVFTDCPPGDGADRIVFAIPPVGSDAKINVMAPLPSFSDPGDTIDGTTQGCASPPCVELDGGPVAGVGFHVLSGSSITIRGLAIHSFQSHGIYLDSSDDCLIEGNHIGTDLIGTVALGNGDEGVYLISSSSNTIGGTTAAARNLISGNVGAGIRVFGVPGESGNTIQGNLIGTDITGLLALPNGYGVLANGDGQIIGGTDPGAGNLISGNVSTGIAMAGQPSPTSILIQGNWIGTDVAGDQPMGNGGYGIVLEGGGSLANTIGGTVVGAGNVISANFRDGVQIRNVGTDPGPSDNLIQGNLVGTDASGLLALGNEGIGIILIDSPSNTVGGPDPGAGNVLAANLGGFGIAVVAFDAVDSGDSNIIQGNIVGLDANGDAPLGHLYTGITLQSVSFTLVGGGLPGERNVSSANDQSGIVVLTGSEETWYATDNVVQGNYVGTDISGTLSRGNTWGIGVQDAANTLIGGTSPGEGNLVAGNSDCGVDILVWFHPGSTTGTRVEGNRIGLDASGSTALPNAGCGVDVYDASSNTIGGVLPGAGNTIWHNSGPGVAIFEYAPEPTTGNQILGNSIHDNGAMGIDLANDGVANPNDLQDPDTGPNEMQNCPDVTRADIGLSDIVIEGTLNSTPLRSFRVELFSSPACDPSGYGQGRDLIGTTDVTTDVNGDAGLSVIVPAAVTPGSPITMTATDTATADTSEFSACFTAEPCTFVVFDQTVLAHDRNTLGWTDPSDANWLKGPIAEVGTYATTGGGVLAGAATLDISADNPGAGTGLYYLLRPSDCGSWQTSPGAEPDRDTLP
jgi:parallel beta-helix repeat protein